jgi:hypothetical protein
MMSICRRGWAPPSVHRPHWVYITCSSTSRQRPQEGTRHPESAPQFPNLQPVAAAGEDTALKLTVGHLALPVWSSRFPGPSPSMRALMIQSDHVPCPNPGLARYVRPWYSHVIVRVSPKQPIKFSTNIPRQYAQTHSVRGRRPRGQQATLSPTHAGLGHP